MMAALALLCVPVSFMSEVNNLAALRLLGGSDQGVFTSAQLQFQAMLFMDMRNSGVLLGQVFWGLWLISWVRSSSGLGSCPGPWASL